jgi:phosphate/sulfate permease
VVAFPLAYRIPSSINTAYTQKSLSFGLTLSSMHGWRNMYDIISFLRSPFIGALFFFFFFSHILRHGTTELQPNSSQQQSFLRLSLVPHRLMWWMGGLPGMMRMNIYDDI